MIIGLRKQSLYFVIRLKSNGHFEYLEKGDWGAFLYALSQCYNGVFHSMVLTIKFIKWIQVFAYCQSCQRFKVWNRHSIKWYFIKGWARINSECLNRMERWVY